jgi:nitronate monooxygenase
LGLDPDAPVAAPTREPFGEAHCAAVEALRPEVVSFHFGLPAPALLDRVRATGAKVLSSATTVSEARDLEARGCDAVIAQGAEAGGHRAMYLTRDISSQPGLFSLLPQVVDAVRVPVIAAGGIADARGVVAAFALGAAGVQLGTAYLRCPEATISAPHKTALTAARDDSTHLTNVFTGRPARGVANKLSRELGPMSSEAPAFPLAAAPIASLRAAAERAGSGDFSPLWAGQSAALAREEPAGALTERLAREARALAGELAR